MTTREPGRQRATWRPIAVPIAAAAMLALAAGCAVGPDYRRPQTGVPVPDAYVATGAAIDTSAAAPIGQAWWTGFGDPTLDRLVQDAIARNHDLQRVTARVLEARALLGGAEADRWPRLEIGGTASRSRSSLAAFGGRGTIDREFYDANLTARYEADLWGRLSRAEEAARATLLQHELNRRVVLQTLVADVVRTWLQVRELEGQLVLAGRTVDSHRHTLALVQERYRRGTAPAQELHLARQALLTAEAAEPEQRRLLAEARRRLEILTGAYPSGRGEDDLAVLDGRALPAPLAAVPAGLPSELVDRRPDLLAAEAALHAATANVGAAKARLFPTLALTGSAGTVSNELSGWFRQGTDVWSLAANLTMPLLNRGATRAQVRAAEARLAQALAGYRQAVLGAFGEVENALDAGAYQAQRERLLTEAATEARRARDLARQRYDAGLDNLLVTLEAERRLLNATSSLLSTRRAHRTARVNLILALGGPWDAAPVDSSEGDTE